MSEAREVANAEEARRVLDLCGRAMVLPAYRFEDGPALAREEAYEAWRAAASAAPAGLVPVPTSDTRSKKSAALPFRSGLMARAASVALGSELGAFVPDPDASRIARLRMAVGFSGRVHCSVLDSSWRCCMVTLTYRGTNGDWQPRHVSDFIKRVRGFMTRRGLEVRYVWVAELQKRGVIHYHVALWLPAGVQLPKPDDCGWWPHGMTRIETARNAVGYLMKYLSKGGRASDHQLPRGARCYGLGGLGWYMRAARRWLSLPGFVQCRADVVRSVSWRRAPGGGWSDPDGVIWPSEFRRVSIGGCFQLQRVLTHARELVSGVVPSGPFSFVCGGA